FPPNLFLFFFHVKIQVPEGLARFISKKYLKDVGRPAEAGKTASGNDGMRNTGITRHSLYADVACPYFICT
ncbi:hypothetical protein, partial [Prolixibacter bellariivorans]|uniref:hypothetical protein n=1 Tax=Prolixibacter bellariivorans TaxID=314319 RepID=UPI00055BE3BB